VCIMSCWVVPAVAADLWGVSLATVLESIRRGELPSRRDCDFLLVDVAPNSPQLPPPKPYVAAPPPPPTFIVAADTGDDEAEEFGGPLNYRAARAASVRRRVGPTARAAA
jgi:hypothetical protein